MLLTIKQVVDQARAQLQDAAKRYWSDQELVDYANDGRRMLYATQPEVYESTEDVTLIEGARQALPNGSNKLFRPIANVSALSQRAITTIDAELLGRSRPRWRAEGAADEIVHVMYRELEPKVYDTYPPAKAGTQIKISYAKPPTDFTTADLAASPPPTLTAEGELASALIDYVLHRAFGKQADTSPDAGQMSGDYLKLFLSKIGAEDQATVGRSTNATTRGMNKEAQR